MVKYKVSGVYVQLLLEVMSRFPQGTKPRRLYEEIFDTVLDRVREYVKLKTELYSPHLEKMLRDYEELIKTGRNYERNPRADFFRHYFFIFQAVVDERGKRYLRDNILELYHENRELREEYTREAYELTLRMINKLGFEGNMLYYNLVES